MSFLSEAQFHECILLFLPIFFRLAVKCLVIKTSKTEREREREGERETGTDRQRERERERER